MMYGTKYDMRHLKHGKCICEKNCTKSFPFQTKIFETEKSKSDCNAR